MASITSAGLGSGLDVNGLVSGLLAAEGRPASLRLSRREASLQAELSAYGTLSSAVTALKEAAAKLAASDTFAGRTATSSATGTLTASATDSAVPGSHSVEVVRTAQAHQLGSPTDGTALTDASTFAGDLVLTVGDADPLTLTLAAGSTLTDVRDAINAAGIAVTATLVNGADDGGGNTIQRLVLTATESGKVGEIVATGAVADDLFLAMMNTDAAGAALATTDELDAQLVVDGLTVTSSGNSFTDVIEGVTLIAVAFDVDGDNTATVTVAEDHAAMKSAANAFVAKYNAMRDTIDRLGAYDADAGRGSVLLGDATLRGIEGQLRGIFTMPAESVFGGLSDLGIELDSDGRLSLDGSAFDAALELDSAAVRDLFVSPDGIAGRLESRLAGYIGDDGMISARTDGIENRIDDLGDQRLALDRRLENLESRLLRQFMALDLLLNQMQATSSSLAQMFENLPGAYRPRGR